MNIAVIAGSNRAGSQSGKVARWVSSELQSQAHQTELFDMHELALPMWTEDIWDKASTQAKNWQTQAERLKACDALVIVSPEWNGTIPPALQNFIMHLNRETVGHKPALLVGVSSGMGGTYPITQLKAFANKNNRMLFIPEYNIIRKVKDVCNTPELNTEDRQDYETKLRLVNSLELLIVYAKHSRALRQEITFDYQHFPHGM